MKKVITLWLLLASLLPAPTFAQKANELTEGDIAAIAETVVQIIVFENGQPISSGSGVLVTSTGTIYTNRHVIDDGTEYGIAVLEDMNELPVLTYYASLSFYFNELDFAILQIDRDVDGNAIIPTTLNLPFMDPNVVAEGSRGDDVYVFGYPGIGEGYFVLTRGQITTIQNGDIGETRLPVLYQTDAEIAPGNSGGLAVNSAGNLLGIPTLVLSEDQTGGRLGGILPFQAILALLEVGVPINDATTLATGSSNSNTSSGLNELCTADIALGDTVRGQIDDTNWGFIYCFTANAGDVVTIQMEATSGNLDGILALLDETSEDPLITIDDQPNGDLSPVIEGFEIPSSGTYIIVAARLGLEEGNSAGQFTLSLVEGGSSASASTNSGSGQFPFAYEPISISCDNGAAITNGVQVTVSQMRPGFTYTATAVGLDGFDPVLAVQYEDGSGLCNDDSDAASRFAFTIPGEGAVGGQTTSSRISFDQPNRNGLADVNLIVGGYGGQGGSFLLVLDGMAVTGADGAGDPFFLTLTESLLSTNESVIVFMMSKARDLDALIEVLDFENDSFFQAQATNGATMVCDDAGTTSCWGDSVGLEQFEVDLGGSRYIGKSTDAMIIVTPQEMENLGLPLLLYRFTSLNQRTSGQYLLVFLVTIAGQ
jgi:hypothetical protein